ncbi:basement membrane-specific heparan sulfate proteoglycan core protein isoform X13 [Canis lupus familiaris]|uniref:basement membrane-specific heparan sulfate proteoglycan core protein isoform X13 n=1 Tax=Canis lupus familiaris TaxID=9615 RepID=UPI0018F67F88|nr:basement membrane-specific heparan sulfate proteoglycan core protein isoform X13 [Canis lupus familiaris]XP_038387619.1 basement membrane-specific heparan sulfate proteoglycan core protein isoform X13 [Canis lupus familiaris]XP_038515932.1 basement membrane-specific heparan sulfate proteoglycan core protein isoform X13 [Canis lupus familiaris]
MGQRAAGALLLALLLHGRLLAVTHGLRAYDGLSLPEDAETVTVGRAGWSYSDLSDDEDLLADDASGDGLGSGDLGSGDFQMVYFRALVNFTRSIHYSPQLEDAGSEEFREVSEAVVDTLESEYLKIPGDQVVSVVFIKELDGWVFVELDVGSEGNADGAQIQEVLHTVISSGSVASYITSPQGFQFRRLGTAQTPPPPPAAVAAAVTPVPQFARVCTEAEFACHSHNECVALEYRCDRRPDCRDMSDELNCEEPVPELSSIPPALVETPPPPVEPQPEATTTRQLPGSPTPQLLLPSPSRPLPCGPHEATCHSGHCIPKDYICDGQEDCKDGSDELDCGPTPPCEPNEFPCGNGHCALKLWHCDGDFDCEDRTDEVDCPAKRPEDVCGPTQFRCVSTNTCIPASFHCDEESDCPDRSDEFGCMPPQVVTPPQESIQVSRGQTVTFTCVAIGVPTPIINWRLNWGHIPSHPRVTVTSEGGRGTLTIRDVKEADQGAYTCEAMNARGMVFGIPDGVLELIPKRGPCPDGHFYLEHSASCLPCFCFGVTNVCQSSRRFRDQIRLRFDQPDDFKGVNVTMPAQPGMPPLSSTQLLIDPALQEFQLVDLSRRFLVHDSFWVLPEQFLGNKVDSYGGFLRYKVRYELARGMLEPVQRPDVVLVGAGFRLLSRGHVPTQPGTLNQRQIQFSEEHWVHESGRPVQRAEMLQVLQSLEAVLIQTVYNAKMASVGLSDIAMDTTVTHATSHGRAHSVEECRCPIGYAGLSCESCDAHFTRVPGGPYLGTCSGCNCNGHASSCDPVYGHCLNCQHNTEGPQCNKCKAGFFGDATKATATACRPCPCPYIDASRRFSDTCFLDTDGQATCDACAPGYTGRRCESCAPGYEGNPIQPGGKCKPTNQEIVRCDERGSVGTSGEACQCKLPALCLQNNVVGRLCNECVAGSFHLSTRNPDGCLKCFCMGVSRQCTSSSWRRAQVQGASEEPGQFSLTNAAGTHTTSEGISSPLPGELVFSSFHSLLTGPYFWSLPSRFRGDKVTSYGGELRFTVTQRPQPGSTPLHGQPLVVLQGNGIVLEHHTSQEPSPGQPSTFTVPFREQAWQRPDGQPATREHLLMALAGIDTLLIQASFSQRPAESRVSGISMDVAVPEDTGQDPALEVEQCTCPPGYRGPSCQDCDTGYTRMPSGLYLGTCERCSCHGHTEVCEPETGTCQGCQHHTEGPQCEQCQPGYYGDAQRGTPQDCQPCPCYGAPAGGQATHTCFLDTDGHPTCDACSPGHSGRHCERCAPGYYGNPSQGQPCQRDGQLPEPIGCGCDPQGSVSSQCDAAGQCHCKAQVEGLTCSHCRPHHFYLSASNPDGCLPCFCMGITQQCVSSSYTRHLISTHFAPGDFQGFALVNPQRNSRLTGGFSVEPVPEGAQLSFSNFAHLGHESFYWQLPEPYQGDKREAYFAQMRRAHKNRTSLSEEQLRTAMTPGRTMGPPKGRGRAQRPSQLDEAQRRMDAEIWELLSSFAAHPHPPAGGLLSRPQPAAALQAAPLSSSSSFSSSSSASGPSSAGSQFSLSYKGFSRLPGSLYYWQLPQAFLGNKVAAYGGKLRYTLSYTAAGQGSPLSDPDVQITGNNIMLVASQPALQGSERKSFEIIFREEFWRRPDGQPATREHLLMALADLDELLVRATFSSMPLATSINSVSLEVAQPGPSEGPRALEVEECRCPPGYIGLSCQDCAPGYTRTGSGLYLGHCELCECNGHSDVCHPETGACSQCQHNAAGEFCELCAPGYYGDATAGTPEDCQPCACPLTNPENMFSRTCESLGAGGYRCTACELGYAGQYCEQCAPGYVGNPSVRGGRCLPQADAAPLVVQVHPARSIVPQGGSHSLRCQVSGSPPHYFYWSREDGRPVPGSTQQRHQGSELHFPSVQPSDAGVYICTCRNLHHANTSRAELLVTEAPSKPITVTVEEQRSQSVRPGADVTFICTAKSKSPAYTLVWTRLHNGKLPTRAMDFNGILTIRNVQPSDAGTYVCTGSNMFAMDQGTATLHVQASGTPSAPVVSIHPPQLTVQPGQLAEFRCSATGSPAPTLQWTGGPGGQIPQKAQIHGGILRLPNIEPSDQAQYLCRAHNSAGQHVARAVLHVHGGSGPRVQVSPERTQVHEGRTVRLYCRAAGVPSTTITWRKEGGSLPPQARSERAEIATLLIPAITAADAGFYLCVATSPAGTAQARIQVVVLPASGASSPPVRIESSSPTVTEGQTLDLNCVVAGLAHTSITWYKRGGSLPPHSQVHGSRLRLPQVSPADSGEYVCRVENEAGAKEASIIVSVFHSTHSGSSYTLAPEGAPAPGGSQPIRIESSSSHVAEGQTLDLNCVVPGQAHAQVMWHRRGGSLPARHQVHGSRLRLPQVTPSDSGEYVCRVVSSSGTQEASVLVSIQQRHGPSHPQGVVYPVRIESSSASLANGHVLDLNCLVASQAPHTITWYKRGGSLPSRHQIVGSRLRIPQVTPADSGEYVCHVSNGGGSQETSLIVTIEGSGPSHVPSVSPPIRIESSSPTVVEGQTLDLNCVVAGQPQATITWYKRGGSLPTQHQAHGSRLRLHHMSVADSGEYVCRANNNIDAQETSIMVSVSPGAGSPSVPGGAVPIRIESSSSHVAEGQTVDLNCVVPGQAHAQVTWHKRGGSLPTHHQAHGSRLRLYQVSPADSGEYVCRVGSSSDPLEASVLVNIEASGSSAIPAPAPGGSQPIRIETSSSHVAEGQTLDLNCVVPGQAHAQVTWHRRGGSLPARHQVHGPLLRLNQVSPADSGEYSCQVTSSSGTLEASVLVTIEPSSPGPIPAPGLAQPIYIEASSSHVAEGQSLDLNCVVPGQAHAQVTWYKRGGSLPARHQTHGSRLRLHHVSPADSGEYVCRVVGGSGPEQEASFTVTVLPSAGSSYRLRSPVISIDPPSSTVQQGQDASFKCLIHDGAAPISLEWKTRNQELEDNVHISPNGSIITIVGTRPSNHGTYRCVASNAYGVAQSVVNLSVHGPPTVSVLPEGPVRVKVGKSVTLECVSAGEPRSSARWTRIGAPNNVEQRMYGVVDSHTVLQISSAKPSDAGTYVCLAQNALGTAQKRVEVIVDTGTVAPGAPQVQVEEAELTVEAGHTATLRCSATGSPMPTIHWSKLRSPLPWQHQLQGDTLIIPRVAQQDSGQYICNATSPAGHAEATIALHVESPPYATTVPEHTSVRAGETVQLQCLAHGTPPLTFQWSRVGGSLPARATARNELLRFESVAPEDSGRYRCQVTNKVGSAEAFAQVFVQGPSGSVLATAIPAGSTPTVQVTPQLETKSIGASVEFHCAVPSDRGTQLRWIKEGGQLPPGHSVQDGVLRIQNLDQSCQGTYICQAHGPWGQAQASAQLVVQALPSVLINIRTSVQTVVVGHAVEFECLALGDPKPQVTWSKVGGRLRPGIVQSGGIVRIAHVELADAGQYRCTATNSAGTTQSHVLLLVQALPQISTPPEVRVPAGSAAAFPCMASGYPTPDITWSKLDGNLPPDSRLENNMLLLPSVRPQDAGTYVCTATNRQGKVKAFAHLQVPERVVPYFTQTPHSFLPLPTIKDAYRKFEIKITFRPDSADGLLLYSGMLLYNGQKRSPGSPTNLANRQPDFISFGLVGGRPEFRFDAGSGMATIRHPTPLALGQFHTVTLLRSLTQGSLIVGSLAPVNGTSQGKFQGLDLNEELYLGGYPDYGAIPKAGLSSGFIGCVRELRIQGEEIIFHDLNLTAHGISHCPTCRDRPCQNGGQCQDSESSSYVCICPAGFTGSRCEHSQALHCHPEACGPDATCVNRPDGRGYTCRCHLGRSGVRCEEGVTVTTPSMSGTGSYLALPALTNTHHELRLDVEFKPLAPDGILLFSGGKSGPVEDFVSLAMVGGHLEFRYELGSGLAVLRSPEPLALGHWHRVSAERLNKDGSLRVNGRRPVLRSSPGKSQGLNLHTLLYLGGVEPSVRLPPATNVSAHFHGCVGEVSVNGKRLDLTYSFLGSRGVGQCYTSSPCERQPCQNGATCMPAGEYEFQCLCLDGFKGDLCELEENPCQLREPCLHGGTCQGTRCLCPPGFSGLRCQQGTVESDWHLEGSGGNDAPGQYGAYFHDDGFLALPGRIFSRSVPEVPETIELEVRTSTANGLLLWQGVDMGEAGRGKDFISLGLQDGHLVFSYQLGSGEARLVSEDPIDDGEWHRVTALREGRRGSIQVDGEELVSGQSPGPNVAVNTKGRVYIGGAPDVTTLTGGRFSSGITGCIKNLVLHSARPGAPPPQPLDLQHGAQAGANTRPCPS